MAEFEFRLELTDERERTAWLRVFRTYERLRASKRAGGDVILHVRGGRLKFSDMTISTDEEDAEDEENEVFSS